MSNPHLALAQPAEPPFGQAQSAQVERAGRALIGWMKPDDAHRFLMSSRNDAAPDPACIEIARHARDVVSARSHGIDQDNLVIDRPEGVNIHPVRGGWCQVVRFARWGQGDSPAAGGRQGFPVKIARRTVRASCPCLRAVSM